MPAYPAHHIQHTLKSDECVKRSDARNFILFVLVSFLVHNSSGLRSFSRWKSGLSEVAAVVLVWVFVLLCLRFFSSMVLKTFKQ